MRHVKQCGVLRLCLRAECGSEEPCSALFFVFSRSEDVTASRGVTTGQMKNSANNQSKHEIRKDLKQAVGSALFRLMVKKNCSQIALAGMAGVSRTTLRGILYAAGKAPSFARLDTLADIIHGLNVPLEQFFALVADELSSGASHTEQPVVSGNLELRIGSQRFQVKLTNVEDVQN